ncbi:hypothetical protein [Shimia sediminis]|uniref:hypothetical protein n=1 Tax=Shimia sediminis TaxID=2497945 RepID=UPI000F8EAF00|nr:hypothetical protein [Shimia sediminis]
MLTILAILGTLTVGMGLMALVDDQDDEDPASEKDETPEEDETIVLGAGDQADGSEDSETFVVTDQWLENPADEDIRDVEYGQSQIKDFDPEEDQLVIEDRTSATEEPVYRLYRNPEGSGFRLAQEDAPLQSFVDLPNLELMDGETLSYTYRVGEEEHTVTLSPEDYPEGLSFYEWDEAQAAHHVLFGGNGGDELQTGSGSYWTFRDDPDAFNHDPGYLSLFTDEPVLVDGGDGDDHIWVGLNATVVGGEGDDTFNMVADPHGGREGDPAEFVDFTAGEDSLHVHYALGPEADLERALETTQLSYDVTTDRTTLTVFGDEVACFEGDRTGLSVGFAAFEEIDSGADSFDAEGNPISRDALEGMDIVIMDGHAAIVYDEYQVPPPSWLSA